MVEKSGKVEIAKKILAVMQSNFDNKLGIQDISKYSKINWDSTKRYLNLFIELGLVEEVKEGTKSVFILKSKQISNETLFSLPLKKEHISLIQKIYGTINLICSSKPTKTFVQKVTVAFADRYATELPRGWYMFGEIMVLPYDYDKDYAHYSTSETEYSDIEKLCKEYFGSTRNVRMKQYQNKDNKLYLLKEDLQKFLTYSIVTEKQKVKELLNCLAILIGKKDSKISSLVDEFCSRTLSIFRNNDNEGIICAQQTILDSFYSVWNLISVYEFYDSLKPFYPEELILIYLNDKIKLCKEEAIEAIDNLDEYMNIQDLPDDLITKNLSNLRGSGRERKIKKDIDKSDVFRKFGLD